MSIRRCREHNDVLVEQKELGDLWDNYGLVGDVVVSIFCYSFLLLLFPSMCAPAHSGPFDPMMLPETVSVRAGLQTARDAERRMAHTSCGPLLPHRPLRLPLR